MKIYKSFITVFIGIIASINVSAINAQSLPFKDSFENTSKTEVTAFLTTPIEMADISLAPFADPKNSQRVGRTYLDGIA